MKMKDLVLRSRSCRRFEEHREISREVLRELVDLGRLSASAMNIQPLKYIISSDRETNSLIFPHLAWAALLEGWDGPEEGERPAGYIVILNDTEISASPECDHGIAAQSIMLGAVEQGLGGCMIGALRRKALKTALSITKQYDVLLVIALGYLAEEVRIEEVRPDGSIAYWRDSSKVHHVPKRSLESVLIGEY